MAFGSAVSLWGVSPPDLWRMTPVEWYATADAYIEANTIPEDDGKGSLTDASVAESRRVIAEAKRRQARKRGEKAD